MLGVCQRLDRTCIITTMTDLLHPELLEVDGRVYRVLSSAAASTSGRRPASHSQQLRQRHFEAEEDAGEDGGSWVGGGGDAAGGGPGGEDEEQASVPIRQEGDSFVARMRLDSVVRRALQRAACHVACAMLCACGSSSGRHACYDPCATAPLLPQLFPVLIGRQGATKRRVEDDTGASISIPGRGAQVHRRGCGVGAGTVRSERAPAACCPLLHGQQRSSKQAAADVASVQPPARPPAGSASRHQGPQPGSGGTRLHPAGPHCGAGAGFTWAQASGVSGSRAVHMMAWSRACTQLDLVAGQALASRAQQLLCAPCLSRRHQTAQLRSAPRVALAGRAGPGPAAHAPALWVSSTADAIT